MNNGFLQLRDYQRAAVDAFLRRESRRELIVLPTGCGKTVCAAEIIRQEIKRKGRVLVGAHREELLSQMSDTAARMGIVSEWEKAEQTAHDGTASLVVASMQSLNERRLNRYSRESFSLIVIDEAHRSLAQSYVNAIDYFGGARLLGLTATPERGDKNDLGKIYERIAYQYDLQSAINDGWLVPIIGVTGKRKIGLDGLRRIRGDIDPKSLEKLMSSQIEAVGECIIDNTLDRLTLVFMPGVGSTILMAEWLRARGIKAAAVHGSVPTAERKRIREQFQAGIITHLVNSDLFLEGVDIPPISAVVMARPTESRVVLQQAIGRGTRPHPGKENLLLVTPEYGTTKFNLCDPFEIFANEKIGALVYQRARKMAAAHDGPIDYSRLIEEARIWLHRNKERAIVRRSRNSNYITFDPITFAEIESVSMPGNLLGGWQTDPATESQKGFLRAASFDRDHVESLTKGEASALISWLKERTDNQELFGFARRWYSEQLEDRDVSRKKIIDWLSSDSYQNLSQHEKNRKLASSR